MCRFISLFALLTLALAAVGANPTETKYTYEQCQGSAMPYPTPDFMLRAIPDSLTPVFVNHIGRHGARYMSSAKTVDKLNRYLHAADSAGSLTPLGRQLMKLCAQVTARTAGRWGALDSLGMAEQRGIASRLHRLTPSLFSDTRVSAISSYVPRCIASMDEFTHQLSRLNNKVEIYTASGRQNNTLLRPWTDDADYKEFIAGEQLKHTYDSYLDATVHTGVAAKLLGPTFPLSDNEKRDFALAACKVVSACGAMALDAAPQRFFTLAEYNALWSVGNLDHYLTHSASTLSSAPMELAAALLKELVETTDEAAKGENSYSVRLRFGHAETLMPLFALMRLAGCYYMTNYFDTVGLHWRDFYVVPMASNLQLILFRSSTGRLYVRADLNEVPVPLIPGRSTIYTPWESAREYLTRCLPLHMQI